MDDAELVRQTLNGKSSAYEVLVQRWSARLTGYIRSKVGSVDVAEDIAQDSLLKAFRYLDSLERPDRFGSWLISIGHRASIDWLKAKARGEIKFADMHSSDVSRPESQWQATDERPEDHCMQREDQHRIKTMIEALPELLREVMVMYYYSDEITYSELGDMLGVSSATINVRLTKARKLLREQLCDREVSDRSPQ